MTARTSGKTGSELYSSNDDLEREASTNQRTPCQPTCVREKQIDRGSNLFAFKPVIRLRLVLGELEHFPTDKTATARLHPRHNCVIGVLSGTGDWRDQNIVSQGRVTTSPVDELIIKEDSQRNRETARLIFLGALAGGLSREAIHSYYGEAEAVHSALSRARPNDLVIVFATDVQLAWNIITTFQPAFSCDEPAKRAEPVPIMSPQPLEAVA